MRRRWRRNHSRAKSCLRNIAAGCALPRSWNAFGKNSLPTVSKANSLPLKEIFRDPQMVPARAALLKTIILAVFLLDARSAVAVDEIWLLTGQVITPLAAPGAKFDPLALELPVVGR